METKGIITIEYEATTDIRKRTLKVNGKTIYVNESNPIFYPCVDASLLDILRRVFIEIEPEGVFSK